MGMLSGGQGCVRAPHSQGGGSLGTRYYKFSAGVVTSHLSSNFFKRGGGSTQVQLFRFKGA